MDRMAQEALIRAKEMYRNTGVFKPDDESAKITTDNYEKKYNPTPPKKDEDNTTTAKEKTHQENKKVNKPSEKSNIFDLLLKDKDKTIILILIILIYDESNIETLMALLYLLM